MRVFLTGASSGIGAALALAYAAPGLEFEADEFRVEALPWKPSEGPI